MNVFQNADGGVMLSQRIYDIASDTVVQKGQVVVLNGGKVEAAAVGQTGPILGIAAESHSGAADAINPGENGTEILVYDGPNAIYQCKAPQVKATGGTATTFVSTDLAAFADDDFIGGFIRLVELGEESTNTDVIGQVRAITDSTGNSKTLTVENGGTICAGDVYEIYPPIGFRKGNLNADKTALVLSATANLALKVVINRREGCIGLMAASHVLAN